MSNSTVDPHAAIAPLRILGIFGGMGPEATANLYSEIVSATPVSKDQDHIPILIYSFPQVPDRTTAIQNNDRSIVPYLVEGVTRLERAGASLIAIACNTAHCFYDDMLEAVLIPILHMIRETAGAVARDYPSCRRVGLLATSGTIASGLYEREFCAGGLEIVYPDGAVQSQCVMQAVYGIKSGRRNDAEEPLCSAATHLQQKGAEAIVLGCTEIPLAFNVRRVSVPVVNATRVLAQAAVREFHAGH